MGKDCMYYYYDGGYCCSLKKSMDQYKYDYSVDSDWVHKYCWSYDHEDCPFRKTQDSSGCYLTSACVHSVGLPDDCVELKTLRGFRDSYMKQSEEMRGDIAQYYSTAPKIVEKINQDNNSINIWKRIYEELVKPSVEYIKIGKYENAYLLYKEYALQLESVFLKNKE